MGISTIWSSSWYNHDAKRDLNGINADVSHVIFSHMKCDSIRHFVGHLVKLLLVGHTFVCRSHFCLSVTLLFLGGWVVPHNFFYSILYAVISYLFFLFLLRDFKNSLKEACF